MQNRRGDFLKKKRIGISIIIGILFVIVAILGAMVGFITDFLWFKEMGYTSVFFKQLFTQLQLGIPTFVILTLLAFAYLMGLKRSYYKRVDIVDTSTIKERTVNLLALGLGAIFGALVTLTTVTRLWFEILKFNNSTEFGILDPIFNMDVSFYIFKLEFLTQINQILIGIIIAFVLLTVLFYSLLLSMRRPKIFEQKVANEFEYDQTANNDIPAISLVALVALERPLILPLVGCLKV
jgi:uncharacterized protein